MLRNILLFHERAKEALADKGQCPWATIKMSVADVMYKLCTMKFEEPIDGEVNVVSKYAAIRGEIKKVFDDLHAATFEKK